MGGVVESAPLASLTKLVQELSLNNEEPPPRYFVKEGNSITDPPPPFIQIPLINLSLLSSSSEDGEEEIEKLKAALTTCGCFQAIDHGIPNSFLDKIRGIIKEFFALSVEEKLKYARPETSIEGYGNDPILSDKQVLDWVDRLLLTVVPEDSRKLQLWPRNPMEFREVLNEYSMKVKNIVHLVLKAAARSLKLEEGCFLNQYGGEEVMVARLNYYPVCPRPDLILGAKAHSDGSVMTILLADKEVEGLQIFKDDQWYRVSTNPHALLVQVGDQLQIMSNGILKSPLHRVSASAEKERTSLALFHFPSPEVEIGPFAGLIDEKRPQQYRKLKDYATINFESFQSGKTALDQVKL